MRKSFPIFLHHFLEQHSRRGRRVGNGVGTRRNGGGNALAGLAAAGDDGHIRELLSDLCHHPGRVGAAAFRMDAPESMRLWMLVSSFVTVMMTGMSTTRETASRFRSEMGELSTTPMAVSYTHLTLPTKA